MCLTTVPTQSLLLDLWPYSRLLWLINYLKISPHKSYTLEQVGGVQQQRDQGNKQLLFLIIEWFEQWI